MNSLSNLPRLSPHQMPDTMQSRAMSAKATELPNKDDDEVHEAFDAFVGEVFFGQMIKAMRKSVGKPAYFHGGRAEEIFQQQLDQVLGEEISKASSETIAEPMFELFQLSRR